MEVTRDTLICTMTAGQFEDWLRSLGLFSQPQTVEKKYVYGLDGIMSLFDCSKSTAERLKKGKIKDACMQNCRQIIVDVEKALELFNS